MQIMRFSYQRRSWLSTPLTSFGLLSLILAMGSGAQAGTITLNFEGFPDSTILSTQYSGLSFTNTIIFTAGISLNEFEFPPHSGVSVASDNNGPITIDFSSPVTSFGGYFTYLEPLALAAFNSADAEVASETSMYSTNDALYGDPGSSPNEFIDLSFAGGISSVTITGDPAGGSFTLDDATFASPSSVPEPPTLSLLLTLSYIALLRRRHYQLLNSRQESM
jgi:hypothetical protein